MNIQSMYRPPFGPRFHFDEAGAGGGAGGAGAGGAAGGAAGGSNQPWYQGKADDAVIGWMQNRGWDKDPQAGLIEATKAHKELQSYVGLPADRLLKLPEKADDEAGWQSVRQRLGAPKEAKEYDFSTVKFADGSELEQGFTDLMRNALHKSGTPKDSAPEIVKAVVKFMDEATAAETAERTAKLQADRQALQREWGSNFDFNRLTAMQGAKRAVGGDEARAAEVISAMENAIGYKSTMEFWRKIGAGTSEDSFVEGGSSGNPVTIQGAKARQQELMADPDWSARYLKGHPKEVAEMNSLLQLIAGAAA